jgi:hypothetical protein
MCFRTLRACLHAHLLLHELLLLLLVALLLCQGAPVERRHQVVDLPLICSL